MSIATKTGDDGTTAIMYGRRVPKTDARIAANGAVDELNAALGVARAALPDVFVTEKILAIQKSKASAIRRLLKDIFSQLSPLFVVEDPDSTFIGLKTLNIVLI